MKIYTKKEIEYTTYQGVPLDQFTKEELIIIIDFLVTDIKDDIRKTKKTFEKPAFLEIYSKMIFEE